MQVKEFNPICCINCKYFDRGDQVFGECRVAFVSIENGEKIHLPLKNLAWQPCNVDDGETGKKMFEPIPED